MGVFYDSVPLSAIVKIRDMMYTVKDPFRLDQGDVSFDAPDTFKQRGRTRRSTTTTRTTCRQPGFRALRQLLAEKMRKKNGIPIGSDGRGAGDQWRHARHLRGDARRCSSRATR